MTKMIKEFQALMGRVRDVEDVASEKEDVNLFIPEGADQPVKKEFVFGSAVEFEESFAEVPVRSMEEPHVYLGGRFLP